MKRLRIILNIEANIGGNMLSIFSTLKEKLNDEEFLSSLSHKMRGQIEICKEMLTEDELEQYCSITTAYKIARKRYIIEHYGKDALDTAIFVRYSDII